MQPAYPAPPSSASAAQIGAKLRLHERGVQPHRQRGQLAGDLLGTGRGVRARRLTLRRRRPARSDPTSRSAAALNERRCRGSMPIGRHLSSRLRDHDGVTVVVRPPDGDRGRSSPALRAGLRRSPAASSSSCFDRRSSAPSRANASASGYPPPRTTETGTRGVAPGAAGGSSPRSMASRCSRITLSGRYWSRWALSTYAQPLDVVVA